MVTQNAFAILAISLCLVVVFIRAGHGDYTASVAIWSFPSVHACAAGKLVDRFAFSRACASIPVVAFAGPPPP